MLLFCVAGGVMSIAEVLVATLMVAFTTVGLVGFMGWRSRMRQF